MKPHILKSNGASAAVQQSIPSGHSDPNLAPASSGVVTKEEVDTSCKSAALLSYLGSPTHSSDPGSPPMLSALKSSSSKTTDSYPFLTLRSKSTDSEYCSYKNNSLNNEYQEGIALKIESILQHRKSLRLSNRLFKIPFMKEKKRMMTNFDPLESLRYDFFPSLKKTLNTWVQLW